MGKAIRVLVVDDSSDDAQLIASELEGAGYEPTCQQVDSSQSLSEALRTNSWDVITCDWFMPGFGAEAALRIIQGHLIEAPVIIVSGKIDEEGAAHAIRSNACDFVSKQRLNRLGSAVDRALRQAENSRKRREAESATRRAASDLKSILNNSLQSFFLLNCEGTIRAFNQIASVRVELFFSRGALREGASIFQFLPDSYLPQGRGEFDRCLSGQIVTSEWNVVAANGEARWFEVNYIPIWQDDTVTGVCVSALDTTSFRSTLDRVADNERRLRTAIAVAGGVAWELDLLRDEIIFLNPPEHGEIDFGVLLPSLASVDERDRGRIVQAVRGALDCGIDLGNGLEVSCGNPPTRLELRGVASRDASGRVVRVTGFVRSLEPLEAKSGRPL